MREGFIKKQAEAYRDAKVHLGPWRSYAKEVVEQWREINHPIRLVDDALSYLDPLELRADIKAGRPIKVWGNGEFDSTHPLLTITWNPVDGTIGRYAAYHLSRALHDYCIHNRLRLSFSPTDELYGALASRFDFSQSAQAAQWTDDVAMGCYYAHFGKWPEIQRPVVVKPDWEGLKEYLAGN
jgi:hypothetical protein